MDSGSLRCPHCGAGAASGAARCGYCRTRLATVSCPSCLSLMFEEAEFCGACGARRTRTAAPAAASCPGCREHMQQVTLGPTTLLECEACDGLWVDAAAFERICADQEAQAAVLHRSAERSSAGQTRVSYRPCVGCGTLMNRVNFAQVSGTIVDVCRRHGTFLDAGELQAIVRFIQTGGLERSRRRQIEELKDQERRLREQETRLANRRASAGTADYRKGYGDLFGSLWD